LHNIREKFTSEGWPI